MDQVLALPGGGTVGFNDYGCGGDDSDGTAIIHCHGGPGCRIQSAAVWVEGCQARGLRLIGIDRPGYGLSSARPGRSIADWAAIAIAVQALKEPLEFGVPE